MDGLNRTAMLDESSVSQALAKSGWSHSVHFYEDETTFIHHLSEFVDAALSAGSCLVVATREHRQLLADCLIGGGFDLLSTTLSGRYIAVDASETLDRFLVEGWPDAELFERTLV